MSRGVGMRPYPPELLDQINLYALHTKQANLEAAKADPKYTSKGSQSIVHAYSRKASIDMDLSLAIYEITKDKYGLIGN